MLDLNWQKTITLKSGRQVLLRYPRLEDAENLLHYFNPIVEEDTFIMATEPKTLEEEQKYIKDCVEDLEKGLSLFIYAFFEDRMVGVVDVRRQRERMSHVGLLGITVAKDFRGDGLGKALMTEAIEQAKEKLGFKIIELGCFANNIPGINLYKQMGFQEFGRLPKALAYKGEYVDHVNFYKEL